MKRKKSDVIVYLVIAAIFCLQLTYTAVRTDRVSQVEAAEIPTGQENAKEEEPSTEDLPMVDISGQVARMAEESLEAQAAGEAADAPALRAASARFTGSTPKEALTITILQPGMQLSM